MADDVRVIGTGNIGEKARQLVDKTPRLKQIGFSVPRRTILAQDFFDGFFQRNGLGRSLDDLDGTDNLEQRIRQGSLTTEEFSILHDVVSSYTSPLVIRSSAEGDARGTGTYDSRVTLNHLGPARKALQRVLASYFSEDAFAFRRDSQSGGGFGVIVEPMVGQLLEYVLAPVYSGFGYTSTSKGEGYVSQVSGLFGGVSSRDGDVITEEIVREHDDRFLNILFRSSSRNQELRRSFTRPCGYVFYRDRVDKWSYSLDEALQSNLFRTKPSALFEMMKRMEDVCGAPQYFEWAMTLEGTTPRYWILQIADVSKKTDVFDFNNPDHVLLDCHTVTGSGEKRAHKIFNCWNPSDVLNLYRFNHDTSDYVLLFSSRLTTRAARGIIPQLCYSNFSGASALIEIQDAYHVGNPIDHFEGQLDATHKFFGVLNYESPSFTNLHALHDREVEEYGSRVYPGTVRLVASERQDRMQVVAID